METRSLLYTGCVKIDGKIFMSEGREELFTSRNGTYRWIPNGATAVGLARAGPRLADSILPRALIRQSSIINSLTIANFAK